MAHPVWVDHVLTDDLTQTDKSGRKEVSHGQGEADENFVVDLCNFVVVVFRFSVMGVLCSFEAAAVARSFVTEVLCSFEAAAVARSFVMEDLCSFGAAGVARSFVMEGLCSFGMVVARPIVMEVLYSFAVVVPLFRAVGLSAKLEL